MKRMRAQQLILSAIAFNILSGPLAANDAQNGIPSGELFRTEVAASTNPLIANSKYQIWIPDDASTFRTLFVFNMRGAGKHLFASDHEWRALAKRTQSAMLYCEFEAHGVRDNGYASSMLKACEQFAAELNLPELPQAPFVLWGHSMGGRVAQDFVRFRPGRVLAFHIALRGNPSDAAFMQEEAPARNVPGLYLMGASDGKPKDIREHFERSRKAKSPRAWVWLPGQSHWPKGMHFKRNQTTPKDWRAWAAHDFVIPWTEAMIRLRLPTATDINESIVNLREIQVESGWLGDIKTGAIAPYHKFRGKRSTASWFPNEQVARAWVAFAYPDDKQL